EEDPMTSLAVNAWTSVDQDPAITRDPIADHFCPECGQPLDVSRPPTPGPTSAPRWLGALLLVVGFAAGLAYVPQAWNGYASVSEIQRQVAVAKGACAQARR